jgi:tetratricopeptide (TPR) repeat protein
MKRGLAGLHAELTNLHAGQAWSNAHASRDLEATKLSNSYPEAGIHILEHGQPPQRRIRWLKAGLKAAQLLNDRRAEGRHTGSLGIAYWRLGQARRAISLFKQALTIARNLPDPIGYSRALRGLGLALHDIGKFRKAIDCHKKALVSD